MKKEDINLEVEVLLKSMTSKELMNFVDDKFNLYTELGYTVRHFRSMSLIEKDNNIITSNRCINHELLNIVKMDEFLKNNL